MEHGLVGIRYSEVKSMTRFKKLPKDLVEDIKLTKSEKKELDNGKNGADK